MQQEVRVTEFLQGTAPVLHILPSHGRPVRSLQRNELSRHLQVPGSQSHLPDLLTGLVVINMTPLAPREP